MAGNPAPEVKKAGGWVMAWGVLLIVAGVVAIVAPGAAALATALLLAWLFVFAGVVELVHAIAQRTHDGFGWKVVAALAMLALGVVMLLFPVASVASLALLIGAFMMANGVSTAMLAFKLKPKAGWGWVLFDGALSIVIAILIASRWPQDSLAFVGLLVGICLISGGVWRIVLGRLLRTGPPAA